MSNALEAPALAFVVTDGGLSVQITATDAAAALEAYGRGAGAKVSMIDGRPGYCALSVPQDSGRGHLTRIARAVPASPPGDLPPADEGRAL